MTTYQPGDIVLVAFPFTGGASSKDRPALVLLDGGDADILAARVTTQPYQTPFDVRLSDWQQAGLLAPRSFGCTNRRRWPNRECAVGSVRSNQATVNKSRRCSNDFSLVGENMRSRRGVKPLLLREPSAGSRCAFFNVLLKSTWTNRSASY
jgi:hypothetical protein